MYVVTVDQKSSRRGPDGVPALLRALASPPKPGRTGGGPLRAFERTAGDEVQALFADGSAVVDALVRLLRVGGWWIGVGIGAVEQPLPATARAGRGPAYVAARQAVEAAKSSAAGLCVRGAGPVQPAAVERAETAAWLLAALLSRRTTQGWQVVDQMTSSDSSARRQVDVAAELGVTPQAVSRRLRVAGWVEEQRGRELLGWLLSDADQRLQDRLEDQTHRRAP